MGRAETVIRRDHERDGGNWYLWVDNNYCDNVQFFSSAERSPTVISRDQRLREEELLCEDEGEHKDAGFGCRDRMLAVSISKGEYLLAPLLRALNRVSQETW